MAQNKNSQHVIKLVSKSKSGRVMKPPKGTIPLLLSYKHEAISLKVSLLF